MTRLQRLPTPMRLKHILQPVNDLTVSNSHQAQLGVSGAHRALLFVKNAAFWRFGLPLLLLAIAYNQRFAWKAYDGVALDAGLDVEGNSVTYTATDIQFE